MRKFLLLSLVCLLIAPSLVLADDSFPSFPMSFYGSAKLDNANLPVGSKVQAFAGNLLVGEVTLSEAGIYGYDNPTKSRLTVGEYSGSSLVFKYLLPGATAALTGNSLNGYSDIFDPGKTQMIDLSFTSVLASPVNQSTGGSSGGGGGGSSVSKATVIPVVPVKTIITPIKTATTSQPIANKEPAQVLGEKVINYSAFNSLVGVENSLAESISQHEAETIMGQQEFSQLDKINNDIYQKFIANCPIKINDAIKNSVAYFIQFGTPTTKRLGAGEQAQSINSYIAAFNKVPSSTAEWKDVIRIANGRWPVERNQAAETLATAKFKKVYLRVPNMKNPNDDAAVTIIAYGLRPVKRNLNNEKIAIKSFKAIFGYTPNSAIDWNVVRSIAYSGAKR
jgi:hypothetical protein